LQQKRSKAGRVHGFVRLWALSVHPSLIAMTAVQNERARKSAPAILNNLTRNFAVRSTSYVS